MTATTQDGSFRFDISRKGDKWSVTVRNLNSMAIDKTGRENDPDPNWGPFTSLEDAKDWALQHANNQLAQRDTELYWL